jgi:hypothetical protein
LNNPPPLGSVGFELELTAKAERLIWPDPRTVDKLATLRGRGETLGDVILRVAGQSSGAYEEATKTATLETSGHRRSASARQVDSADAAGRRGDGPSISRRHGSRQ